MRYEDTQIISLIKKNNPKFSFDNKKINIFHPPWIINPNMHPCSSRAKNFQAHPAGLLHHAVHDHLDLLDAWALCGCILAGDLFEHIGTKIGFEKVVNYTEAKPIDMIHKYVSQVEYTTFPKNKFLLPWG